MIGCGTGGASAWLMAKADRHMGVRTEYQAVYGVGLVLAAYAGATPAGSDGFLGGFAARFAVVVLNQILCSCFLEYGETTAEAAMLVRFTLFGAVLSSMYGIVDWLPAIGLALFVVFVIRPPVLALVLLKARMSWPARLFIAWFGPRGLNSLLLALLLVIADVPGAEALLATVGVVVGSRRSRMGGPHCRWPLGTRGWSQRTRWWRSARRWPRRYSTSTWTPLTGSRLPSSRWRWRQANRQFLLEVRPGSTYENDLVGIPSSVRVRSDEVIKWASDNPLDRQVVAYCT